MALEALQASLTVTPAKILGTAAWQVSSALIGGMAEQLTVGTVASLTVKVVEQVALLPAASVAVTVIECVPTSTSVPSAGDWLNVMAPVPVQASFTLTPPKTS